MAETLERERACPDLLATDSPFTEAPLRAQVNLRMDPSNEAALERLSGGLGVSPPKTPNRVVSHKDVDILWLSYSSTKGRSVSP